MLVGERVQKCTTSSLLANFQFREAPKMDRNEKIATPKFPLTLRGSTYDNVGESEPEDEGIENDYSDDSGTGGPLVQCNQCVLGGCSQHESSPALTNTSEGYDSAQETGELLASPSTTINT